MHSSIVEALHRGQKREIRDQITAHYQRAIENVARERRTPWLKRVTRTLLNEPNQVVLDVSWEGRTVKRAVCKIVSIRFIDTGWCVTTVSVIARTFSLVDGVLPIVLPNHLIERIMQRKSIDRALDAVKYLAPTVGIAVSLFRLPADEVLLPCGDAATPGDDGAIQMIWHREYPGEVRVLVTYIAQHQLRPDQRIELAEMWGVAAKLRQEAIEAVERRL